MLFNIDFDGVLVPNTYEKLLFDKVNNEKLSFSECNPVWDWYDRLVASPLKLDTQLLHSLRMLKDEGHHIRLWTNRAYTLKKQTLFNLGEWTGLFDSFEFYAGRKSESRVEGVAMDNCITNLSCAEYGGIHYEWKGVN
jgi:hypothetical protein